MRIEIEVEFGSRFQGKVWRDFLKDMLITFQEYFEGRHKKNRMGIKIIN